METAMRMAISALIDGLVAVLKAADEDEAHREASAAAQEALNIMVNQGIAVAPDEGGC